MRMIDSEVRDHAESQSWEYSKRTLIDLGVAFGSSFAFLLELSQLTGRTIPVYSPEFAVLAVTTGLVAGSIASAVQRLSIEAVYKSRSRGFERPRPQNPVCQVLLSAAYK